MSDNTADTRLVDLVKDWLIAEQDARSAEQALARAHDAIEEWQRQHPGRAA